MDKRRKAVHDLNNLLSVVMGNAELSAACLKDEDFEEIEERLSSILFAVQKASYILRQLKKPDVIIQE